MTASIARRTLAVRGMKVSVHRRERLEVLAAPVKVTVMGKSLGLRDWCMGGLWWAS